jgi:phytoene dehydrogenase-like protein
MMRDSESADVVIIGGGLAGLAAGICCGAGGQRVTVLEPYGSAVGAQFSA